MESTPPKKVQLSPQSASTPQFSSYHDQLSNLGMRIRASVDLNYQPGAYNRSKIPENLQNPQAMLVNQRTTSSNLDSMFNSSSSSSQQKRSRRDDDDEDF
ncbi:hypothetical protein Kpol_520p41 [Vanderwaltozyma polyspora DSM 70294]|uniref:Damage-regulated import facilitator 1 n=1 Tax=Vanderwaltozyma polyspora (strain ATCC 22028 / DSM 70294 / BCRC 21397 / CBS 2163 / NBRC 10782 / NRRL Y-8283 / UCD 57-17) TaxID=436907 RepID=A7TMC4_VANPO|nr:uncharacterized protein Kpol_520p41 [Vanderwaltozyma polyspora DSM 70294]EDO16618.1 hypothetical protein Kpol_520p41 [Vanderwaltozyma polyspora DSM 70294]